MNAKWILRIACMVQIAAMGILYAFEAPRMKDMGIGETTIGIILGVSSGTFILSGLIWGRLADRFHWHKKIAIWGSIILSVVCIYFSFCTSTWQFVVYAITKAMAIPMVVGMMPAIAVKSFGQNRKGRDFGIFRAFGSLGFILGGMVLPLIFNDIPSVARAGAVSIFMSFFLLQGLPEPDANVSPGNPLKLGELGAALKLFFVAFLLIALSEPAVQGFYSAYARHLGGSTRLLGVLFGTMGFIALIFLPLMGKWIDRVNPVFILSVAFMAYALRIFSTSFIDQAELLWLPLLLHGVSWGGTEVSAVVYVSSLVEEDQKATVLSYYIAVRMLGNLLGSGLSGYLAENSGYIFMFRTMSLFAFVGAFIYIFGTYLLKRSGKRVIG